MYDYHTHTDFSHDGTAPMNEMIDTAIKSGIKEIAVTDHYDPDSFDSETVFDLDLEKYQKALMEAPVLYKGRIKVIKGIEIGIQHGNTMQKCENAAGAFPYDFIIGSFHSACGLDLRMQYFRGGETDTEKAYHDFYTYMLDCISKFKNFDVLGHINSVERYSEYVPDYAPYMEIIENILKSLIESGRGLDFNTSSFRYGMGRTTPASEILKLYKELGGEIITFGSDAHSVRDVGYMYHEAVEIIKAHGFKYIALFENRNPTFQKI